jgi:hypothetical protein
MAKYNEILSGRFNRGLLKFFSMKGPAPSPQLSGEISTFLQMFSGVEDTFLFSLERFAQAIAVAPGAAATGGFQLRNPTGTNVIAVLESLIVNAAAVDTFNVTVALNNPADLTTANTNNSTDGRQRTTGSLLFSSQATGPGLLAGNLFGFTVLASTPVELINHQDQEIVLSPGTAIRVTNSTVNSPIRVSMRWRERALEETERT